MVEMLLDVAVGRMVDVESGQVDRYGRLMILGAEEARRMPSGRGMEAVPVALDGETMRSEARSVA